VWPADPDSLIAHQQQLAIAAPEPCALDPGTMSIGGCWVCFRVALSVPVLIMIQHGAPQ
jgi:hypothetical protein